MYQLHSLPGSSHRVLADLALSAGKSPVLDVGTAEGYLGRLLHGRGLALDGIEPRQEFADAARPYYRRVFGCPVEEFDPQDRYEVIVLGDVLEHLVDPLSVLKQLRGYLTSDGIILASVPNVAHLAVRLLLLSGRFPRMERGPLDRSHLHFYTLATAGELLSQAGLRVVDQRATCVPLSDIVSARFRLAAQIAHPVQMAAVRALPGMFGYQWVFVAAPS